MNSKEARLEKKLIHFYLINNILKEKKIKKIIFNTGDILLKKHGIKRAPESLYFIYRNLMKEPEIHTLPSLINKKPSLNREGKDKMYSAFWRMIEMEAQNKSIRTINYYGLPSNQISFVWQQLKKIKKPGVICSFELDQEKVQWQEKYAAQFLKDKEIQTLVFNKNILECSHILNTSNCLTILDLDLMKNGTPELVKKIAGLIPKSKTIINITTCIGRYITKQQYISSFKEILQKETEENYKVNYWFSGKYIDNIIPMVWEHLSIGG